MSKAQPLLTRQGERIAITHGLRTPFARQASDFHGIPALELGRILFLLLYFSFYIYIL